MKIEIYDKLGNNIGTARSIRVKREQYRREYTNNVGVRMEYWGHPDTIKIEMREVAILDQGNLMAMTVDVKLSQAHTPDAWFRNCMVTECTRISGDEPQLWNNWTLINSMNMAVSRMEGLSFPGELASPMHGGHHSDNRALKEWEEIWG